ncbi:MAG TPA: dipeptide ABC transporter ATP-binding protein [Pelomicrobium sp.]|nr:dipeptide ABC transporter ATP-binding protein [Pelomicrobium sp.]
MSDHVITVEDLRTVIHTGAAPVRAVDGVSFSIRRGETFALLGESGCGKSMTALSLLRLLPDTGEIVAGSVRLGEVDLLQLTEAEMRGVRGGGLAMIFQEPGTSLNAVLDVGQQIVETLTRHTPLRGSAARRRAAELLALVGMPDPERRLDVYPFQLSGGRKQRVMIAMALAGEPQLLVADEPTTALDVTIQAQVLELLKRLQEKSGMAILLVTHDLGVVANNADTVAVMYAGEIVELAGREAFFREPLHPYSQKLFAAMPAEGSRGRRLAAIGGTVPPLDQEFAGCRFAERCDLAWERCRREPPRLLRQEGGRGVRCHLYQDSGIGDQGSTKVTADRAGIAGAVAGNRRAASGPLLEARDLKVHFPIHRGVFRRVVGHVKAVDGVSLEIDAGRTLALVGESGSGKTTVGKALLQLLRPSAGSVRFDGVELTRLSRGELRPRRRRFQIVFQDPFSSLNPRMRVSEIIEEGMLSLGVGGGERERERRVVELLERVGLPGEARQRYPHEFSGGQRQRIAIARAIAVEPDLVVCDEPTSALDVSVQAQIVNLLKELQETLGIAYLFITHNIGVVAHLADVVAVMYLGRIVERGTVEEVLRAPQHPYTQALLSAVPVVEPASRRETIRLAGDLPSPASPPAGCHFHPRCPQAMEVCRARYPGPTRLSATREVHCHLHGSGD